MSLSRSSASRQHPESLANLREELGLNQSAISRYFAWLGGITVGDLGTALTSGASISESIGQRLSNTLFLAAVAAIMSIPTAILLGLLSVRYHNRWPDKLISASTLASISLPEFFVGYLLIFVFGVKLAWFSKRCDSL